MTLTKLRDFLVTLLLVTSLLGCSNHIVDNSLDEMPEDFNFKLIYGTYGKQMIDTFNAVVVKDLVEDGTIEAKISLTDEEMQRIFKEMITRNIMGELNIPNEYDNLCASEPPAYSAWTIQVSGETKSIFIQPMCEYPEDVLRLIQLEHFVFEILSENDAYKRLPKSKGEYE